MGGTLLTRDEIVSAVNRVLIDGFEKTEDQLRADAHLYNDLGIDSLDAVDMLVYLEEKIGLTVNPTHFKNVRQLGDVYHVVEKVLKDETDELDGSASAFALDADSPNKAAST